DARDFAAWRERALGFELIFVFDDERVREIDASRFHRDHHLPFARDGIRQLGQFQALGRSDLCAQQGLHRARSISTARACTLSTPSPGAGQCGVMTARPVLSGKAAAAAQPPLVSETANTISLSPCRSGSCSVSLNPTMPR